MAVVTELQLAILCLISYVVFYSCYDKVKKKLNIGPKLKQIFGFKNMNYSLKEINKVLALAGLTLYAYSFINLNNSYDIKLLRKYAFYQLVIHGNFSIYTFYDKYFGPKKFAMFFGSSALTSMLLIQFEFIDPKFSILSLMIATLHFYTMETKPNGLQIRPYGYLALLLSLAAIAYYGYNNYLS